LFEPLLPDVASLVILGDYRRRDNDDKLFKRTVLSLDCKGVSSQIKQTVLPLPSSGREVH